MNDNRKGSFWDLSKRPLNTEESYFIASNLNKIEKSRQNQLNFHNDAKNFFDSYPIIAIIITLIMLAFTIKFIICDTRIFQVLYEVIFGG